MNAKRTSPILPAILSGAVWCPHFRVLLLSLIFSGVALAQDYDLVISGGRVIDPESRLDAIRNVGITKGKIRSVTSRRLQGRNRIDAAGLIVAPGFIDLHVHDMNAENHRFQAMDGVTSALELEVGTGEVDRWYAERKGKTLINFGVSIGHIPARMKVMGDAPGFLPGGKDKAATKAASDAEIEKLKAEIAHGLDRGAAAVGFGIAYTPTASHWEITEMFRVAARYRASCHVHMRYARDKEPSNSIEALEEVIAAAVATGAPLHVVHIQSSGGPATPQLLQLIGEARAHGLDVTTECYPYTAGMTDLKSALFDEGWRESMVIDYKDLQWSATGERLTPETFERYRKQGGLVFVHSNTEEIVRGALASPLTLIASDGFHKHPRGAGTYSRVLGRYARDGRLLNWGDALKKMTLMPAQRLEQRVPKMKDKGRVRVGADADLTLFDPNQIIDNATYEAPARFSSGIKHVLVNGVAVVKDGQLQEGVTPGQPIRAPIR